MSRAVHGGSGVLLVLAALLCRGGFAAAATAPPARWTEAKAETRIEHGTYRIVSKGEAFWADQDVRKLKQVLDSVLALCQSNPPRCPPQHLIDDLKAKLAEKEAALATAKAGRSLTLASCTGYYGRRPSPAGPTYTRFRCEATLVGKTWKSGAAMVYSFYLRPGGWNGRPTKHGFRLLGLKLKPAA